MNLPPYLAALESEAIHILRDGVAEAERPVILFSGGKDSTVLAHLACKAFNPGPSPMPLLHVDSTWEFRDVLSFRDRFAAERGFEVIVFANEDGRARGLNPVDHGDLYTGEMRSSALRQALDRGRYDVIFGGARRDEEPARAKERIVSVRAANHVWDPRQQRPEIAALYNWRRGTGQTLRVFPLSNWTEHDLWTYILLEDLSLSPLYFAADRPVVERDGAMIVVDDPDRWTWGGRIRVERVRFRSLGCWPVTAAVRSDATEASGIMRELLTASLSERHGRVSDSGSLERHKREGYF